MVGLPISVHCPCTIFREYGLRNRLGAGPQPFGAFRRSKAKGATMATIVMTDNDFGGAEFERRLVEGAGLEFRSYNDEGDRTPEQIISHLAAAGAAGAANAKPQAVGAITSYGRYTAEVFAALPNLAVVSKTGTGVDNIDVEAATRNGTVVCNVPGYGTEVVSDHAIALALAVLRRINETDADLRAGIWDFRRRRPLGQVHGRTFGVVGYGSIGRAAARKARGLGFNVVVWDRKGVPGRRTPEDFPYLGLDELLETADVVSFHVALAPETRHLLSAECIGHMKKDAVVVNTSRGAVVDTKALAAALQADALWGAGLDVFEGEPLSPDDPILTAPHTVLSPHDGYWSEESAVDLRTQAAENAIAVMQGKSPGHCMNPEALPAAWAKLS